MARILELRKRTKDEFEYVTFKVEGGMIKRLWGYPDGSCDCTDTEEALIDLSWSREQDWDFPVFSVSIHVPPLDEPFNVDSRESLSVGALLRLEEMEHLRDLLNEAIAKAGGV